MNLITSVGSRLKKLRVENEYSQRQIAEYLEIDQSNLSKIENDKRNLNLTLLDKITNLYNCTPEYLLGESEEYEKIAYKSGKDIDLKAIGKINTLANHLSILRKIETEKKTKLPKLNINLRRQFGIDEYSPINIFTLLPTKIDNLTIVWFPMKKSVNGCCFKNDIDSIILINSLHPIGRQNINLAHELYHLLDDAENYIVCSEKFNDKIEKEADDFASNFLMTNHALYDFIETNDIDEWSVEDVVKCEQYFQIDHDSLIQRLNSEKLIDETQMKEFSSVDIKYKAGRLGYDISLYKASDENKDCYSVGHMIPLAEKVCKMGRISIGKRREILNDLFRQDIIYKSLR